MIKNFNNNLVICLLVIGIFTVNIISAVSPPVQYNTNGGLEVAGVDFSTIKISTNRTAVANVYNATNGLPVYQGVSCQFQVFRVGDNGSLIFTNNTPQQINNTFYFGIPSSVYTVQGEYTRIIQCNTTTEGGFYKSTFDATTTGNSQIISTAQALIYMGFFGVLFFLFFGVLLLIAKLPAGNVKDPLTKQVINITNMKYVTGVLVVIEYLFVFAMLYISANLASAYLSDTLFSTYLLALFRISFGVLPIIILGWFAWIIYNIANDRDMKKLLSRGFELDGRNQL